MHKLFEDMMGNKVVKILDSLDESDQRVLMDSKHDRLMLEDGSFDGYNFLESVGKQFKKCEVVNSSRNCSIQGLKYLSNITSLNMDLYSNEKFEFSVFQHLESCSVHWNKSFSFDFERCQKLKRLYISYYNGGCLKDFGGIGFLDFLEIFNAKKLTTLDGVNELKSLKSLSIDQAAKLSNISCLTGNQSIEDLVISGKNNVVDYSALCNMKNLKSLSIARKSIDSLDFVKDIKKLERLHLGNTNVLDGNMESIIDNPAINEAIFRDKKHYDLKGKEIDKILKHRGL